jgi:hypothetical protein
VARPRARPAARRSSGCRVTPEIQREFGVEPAKAAAGREGIVNLSPTLIEAMAAAAYEATRTPSFPAWSDVTPSYRADMAKAVTAAVQAGVGAGGITINEERKVA